MGGRSLAGQGGAGSFRWLVPVAGVPPSIAVENRMPGTRAWRLPGPPADIGGLAFGSVAGYVSQQSVTAGEIERVYVSAPRATRVEIRVFRMGWYHGLGGREVLVSRPLRLRAQPPCLHRSATGFTECRWHPTLSFVIPPALPSGVYIVRMDVPGGAADCLFVVGSPRPARLLVQIPTATYEAYNAWGGDSLYPGGDPVGITGTTQGVEVSYVRPYDSDTGAGQFFARDVAMVRFLERYGYPVSYTTSESVDRDPSQLLKARAVLDIGHSEYWSNRQRAAFIRARNAGVDLLFFSSDTMGWRVRYARASASASQALEADHSIVSYKEFFARDPDRADATGPFADRGAGLMGSAYVGCITPRLTPTGVPVYRYYAWAPTMPLQPAWLFARTGITSRTRIPGIVGYELDRTTSQSPAGVRVIGSGQATCQRTAIKPGDPVPGPGADLAQTTLYVARSGALVFASGTLGWELGLEPVPSASPDAPLRPNPHLVRLTRNLLNHVLARR